MGYFDHILFFLTFNFLLVILIFWGITLLGSFFFNKNEYKSRNEYYECGFVSLSDFNFKLNMGTFATMLLVIFYDVELLFTVPFLINSNYDLVEHYASVLFLYTFIYITFYIDLYEDIISWDM